MQQQFGSSHVETRTPASTRHPQSAHLIAMCLLYGESRSRLRLAGRRASDLASPGGPNVRARVLQPRPPQGRDLAPPRPSPALPDHPVSPDPRRHPRQPRGGQGTAPAGLLCQEPARRAPHGREPLSIRGRVQAACTHDPDRATAAEDRPEPREGAGPVPGNPISATAQTPLVTFGSDPLEFYACRRPAPRARSRQPGALSPASHRQAWWRGRTPAPLLAPAALLPTAGGLDFRRTGP